MNVDRSGLSFENVISVVLDERAMGQGYLIARFKEWPTMLNQAGKRIGDEFGRRDERQIVSD